MSTNLDSNNYSSEVLWDSKTLIQRDFKNKTAMQHATDTKLGAVIEFDRIPTTHTHPHTHTKKKRLGWYSHTGASSSSSFDYYFFHFLIPLHSKLYFNCIKVNISYSVYSISPSAWLFAPLPSTSFCIFLAPSHVCLLLQGTRRWRLTKKLYYLQHDGSSCPITTTKMTTDANNAYPV